MKERIKQIIETVGIKKTEFARRISVSPPFVSEMCSGAKSPSDRTISDICRVFNVSEQWLRTGEGEMFKKISETEELEQIFSEIVVSDDVLIKRIIRAYWGLSDSEKAAVRKLIDSFATDSASGSDALPQIAPLSKGDDETNGESEEAAFQRRMATPFAARGGGLQGSNETRARHLKALEEDIRRKRERGELD